MTNEKAVAEEAEEKIQNPQLDVTKMDTLGMNYVLDFEELDELEELEHERNRLMKRGQQFMDMLKMAQGMTDIETIRNGMGQMMRKSGYMNSLKFDSKEQLEPEAAVVNEAIQDNGPEFDDKSGLTKLKQRGSFQLYKEGDSLRWLAVYSNKFKDNDNPPEIISEASHKNFADMVDKGQVGYPELWYWHIPGTRFGVADYVAYDDSGFALASGTIDEGKEDVAQSIAKQGGQLVSHGMPTEFIERDEKDKSIITQHITTEISVLPAKMAANKLTNFIVNEREAKGMSLPQEKADTLRDFGFNVDEIQQGLEAKAKDAKANGIEYKETETVVEEVLEVEVEVDTDYVTRDDLTNLIGDMAETIKGLKTELVELKQYQAQGVEEQLKQTPAASLTAIWQSAIGSEEAKIDGRTKLAKEGPEETPPGKLVNNSTLPSLVNGLVNNSHQGWNQ